MFRHCWIHTEDGTNQIGVMWVFVGYYIPVVLCLLFDVVLYLKISGQMYRWHQASVFYYCSCDCVSSLVAGINEFNSFSKSQSSN